MAHLPRSMPPPSGTAQQMASRANGSHCPPSSLPPLRRTIRSALAIAMTRRISRKSKALSRKAISSRRPLPRPHLGKSVPAAKRPMTRAPPSRMSRNNCAPSCTSSTVMSIASFALIYQPTFTSPCYAHQCPFTIPLNVVSFSGTQEPQCPPN